MRRRLGIYLASFALLMAGMTLWWSLVPHEYSEAFVARLAECRTLNDVERFLGHGQLDERVDPEFVGYYWHLRSRDSRVDWSVQIVVDKRGEVALINYIPRQRQPTLMDRMRRWLKLR